MKARIEEKSTVRAAEELRWKSFVMVKREEVCADEVEILDVSEDIFGRDEVRFKYNGKTYVSFVIARMA